MSRPTVRDVARLSGLSLATVSRAINDSGSVSAEARERVLDAVQQLRFSPTDAARNLRRARSGTIGLVVPNLTNPFFATLVHQISQRLDERDQRLLLCVNVSTENAVNLVRSRAVDGVLFVGGNQLDLYELLMANQSVPVVAIDRDPQSLSNACYGVDNERGSKAVTQHLVDLGHTRIHYIQGHKGVNVSEERLAGFLKVVQAANVEHSVSTVSSNEQGGYQAAMAMMATANPPTAIFGMNDMIALGVMRALRELGKRVPQDIAVSGFDGIPMTEFMSPQLTTYRQPIEEMARLGVERLLRDIASPQDRHKEQLIFRLPGELLIRASTTGGTQ